MASQQQGWGGFLALDYETTFGEDPDPIGAQLLPYHTMGLQAMEERVENDMITGRRDDHDMLAGSRKVEGDIVFPLDQAYLPFILRAAFGQTSSPWKVADTQPSLIFEDQLPKLTLYEKFSGCKVSKLGFSWEKDSRLKVTMGVLGSSSAKSGTPYDANATAIPTGVPYLFHNFALSIGGTAFARCTKLSLDIDFGLVDEHYVIASQQEAIDILEGRVKVSGSMTVILDNVGEALWDDAIARTERAVVLTAAPYVNLPTLTITMKEVKFQRPTKNVDGPAGRMLELPFYAYYEDASPDVSIIEFAIA